MKKITLYLFIPLGFFTSCKTEKKDIQKPNKIETKQIIETFIPDTIKMYEGVPNGLLNGATIKKDVSNIELFNFSDNESKDTFKIEIPKGQIEYSKSKVTIINSEGRTIYSIVFPTFFLQDGYELIPNTPENLDSIQERLFNEDFERKLTKEFYEKYYTDKIKKFFKKAVFEVKKNEYIFFIEYALNKKVRNEILKYPKIICASFPIHVGEEGTSFIGYSKTKKQAYIFAETD
jgi:hypothetical protein